MTTTDTQTFIDELRTQLSNAPDGVDTATIEAAINALVNPEEEQVKVWFLLDRSGSMQPVASDVRRVSRQFNSTATTRSRSSWTASASATFLN